MLLELPLRLPLPLRQIEGQYIHDLTEELQVGGNGKDASYLKAPSKYGRKECYESGFDNTLRGQWATTGSCTTRMTSIRTTTSRIWSGCCARSTCGCMVWRP